MARKKISQLPAIGTSLLTDEYEINSGGISKKVTGNQMLTAFGLSLGLAGLTTNRALKATSATSLGNSSWSYNGDTYYNEGTIVTPNTQASGFLNYIPAAGSAGSKASGLLTLNMAAIFGGESVTINGMYYEYDGFAWYDSSFFNYDPDICVVINGDPFNTIVTATDNFDTTITIEADAIGAAGNAITTTTSPSNGDINFGAATLLGGTDATAIPINGDVVTIGGRTYTFNGTNWIDLAASTQSTLILSINGDALRAVNATVGVGGYTLTAIVAGAAGNSIGTSVNNSRTDFNFPLSTLTGGVTEVKTFGDLGKTTNRVNALYVGIIDYSTTLIYKNAGTEVARLSGSSLLIGTTSDSARLFVKGSDTSNSTTTFLAQNSAGTSLIAARNGQLVTIQTLTVGLGAGNNQYSTVLGTSALNANSTGVQNVAIGFQALLSNNGSSNLAIGVQALYQATISGQNCVVGNYAMQYLTTAASSGNAAFGNYALNRGVGVGNSAIGYQSGYWNTGDRNIFVGLYAGLYETGSDKLYISSQLYGDEATGRAGSLIYGIQNATTLSQQLQFNASVGLFALPVASAVMDLNSTTKGFLAPRMTTAQKNAIAAPATGLLVFDTDLAAFYFYDGAAWTAIGGGGGGGTVTTVSVVTNQGVSGSVANPTTTPAITLTLGALTGVTSFNGMVITANTGVVTTGTWQGTAIADAYISSATAWNNKLDKTGGTMSGNILFTGGNGIDTTATGGTDTLSIGVTNAEVINYGNSSTVHNFLGTAIYELQVNSYVTDKLMTLNYGGAVSSGTGVGFEIEENAVITGYFKTNGTRDGFSFLAPANAFVGTLMFSATATLTVSATASISGTNTGDQTITLTGDVTGSGTGSFATALATVTAAKGGTGQTSYAVGDILYASGATALSKLADVAAGSYLRSGGVTTAPVWSTVTLPNSATQGDIMVATSANTYGSITAPATGRVFISQGTGTLPVFSSALTYASNDLTNTASTNSAISMTTVNANSGGAAQSRYAADNGTYINLCSILGTGFTTAGLNVANLAKNVTNSNVGFLFQSSVANTKFWFAIGGSAAANEVARITPVGLGLMTLADPTAYLTLGAGTAAANTAPLKFTSGTNLTTAVAGTMEYNGTNLFFTRTGTTRENVLIGNDAAAAPSTSVLTAFTNYYGTGGTVALSTPNSWASINISGTTYKVPLYT